jgi:hypothetical protein
VKPESVRIEGEAAAGVQNAFVGQGGFHSHVFFHRSPFENGLDVKGIGLS